MMKEYFTTFYLDKERDIVVNLYKTGEDELTYIIETPNHNTGNLITNLAKISGKEITRNEKGLKIVTGTIPASINSKNEEVYLSDLDEDNLRELLGNLIGRVKYLEKKVRCGNE